VPNPLAGSVPEKSPVTLIANSHGGRGEFLSTVPRFFTASCSLPEAKRGSLFDGVRQVSDIRDWNVLSGSPLYPPATQFLTKTTTTTT